MKLHSPVSPQGIPLHFRQGWKRDAVLSKADNPLYTLDNVILTPHMGWKGLETRQRLVSILAGNVKGFLEGKPVNVVS